MLEKLTKCAEMEFEKGVENVDTKEMGEVVDIIKDLAEAEYYAKITKAMDEAEYGEEYDYMGAYEDDMRKGYRGQPRDSRGRYMSRRGRGRRGYEEPMYHMPLEMYKDYSAEELRDMDRNTMGRMYYTEGSTGGSMATRSQGSMNGGRDSREGRSGTSRRGYMEAKEQGKEKGEKMKELENYMKSMAEDLTEAIEGATPEERAMAKNKLSVLVSKM